MIPLCFELHAEPCRNEPYNEMLLYEASKLINKSCDNPCKPDSYGQRLDKIVRSLPLCANEPDRICFKNLVEKIAGNILVKPCTKLQYNIDWSSHKGHKNPSNQVKFKMQFITPPRVIVKEEYLIYDAIGMVSAIGGTMGLCISFSFSGLSALILRCFETVLFCDECESSEKICNDQKQGIRKVTPCNASEQVITRADLDLKEAKILEKVKQMIKDEVR